MHKIELSTVAFYEGHRPRSLALRDWAVPLAHPVPNTLTAVYGTRSKPEAFVAAHAYAVRNRLQFTIIDFIVALEYKPNPSVMKPGELDNHDFFSMLRMASSMNEQVSQWIRTGLAPSDERVNLLDQLELKEALMQEPSLLGVLAESQACRHVKLIACPAMTLLTDKPLNLGIVPHRHWSAIQEATCRLDPTIHITLEPPATASPPQTVKASAKSAAVPRPSKPRAR